MAIKFATGARVRVQLHEGMYEGTVKYFDEKKEILSIESCFNMETKEHSADVLNFYGNEINCVKLLEDEKQIEDTAAKQIKERRSFLFSSDFTEATLKSKRDRSIENLNKYTINANVKPTIKTKPQQQQQQQEITRADLKQFQHILLGDLESALLVLEKNLKGVKEIGINFYGDIQRNGYISVISITNGVITYIFDVVSIFSEDYDTEKQFMWAIGELLEKQTVLKVLYDSKFVADILYNQFKISIKNAFDLTVADATCYRDAHGSYPRNIKCAEMLINENLPHFSHKLSKINEIDWLKRPIGIEAKYVILSETYYLLDLFDVLNFKLIERFKKGCELNMNLVRNCNKQEKLNEYYRDRNSLPEEFNTITIGGEEEPKSPTQMLTRKNAIKPSNKKQFMMSVNDLQKCLLEELESGEAKKVNGSKEVSAPTIVNGQPEKFCTSESVSYSSDLNNNINSGSNTNSNSYSEKLCNYSYNKEYDEERKKMVTKRNIPPAGMSVPIPMSKSNGRIKSSKLFF